MTSRSVVTMAESSPMEDDFLETEAFHRRSQCCWLWNSACKSDWERIPRSEGEQQKSHNGSWYGKSVKALENAFKFLEVYASSKWKTFIRRFNKTSNRSKPSKFGYDPLSYAMNFDEGPNGNLEAVNDDMLPQSFSFRYAAIDVQKETTAFASTWRLTCARCRRALSNSVS